MLFWAVVSNSTEEAVELLTSREEAEAIVQPWDRDEPEQAGALRVEKIEFETSPNQPARLRPSAPTLSLRAPRVPSTRFKAYDRSRATVTSPHGRPSGV
jgi:hypothetical protein